MSQPQENSENDFRSKKRSDRNIETMIATQYSRQAFDSYKKQTTNRFSIILGGALVLSLLGNIVQSTKSIPTRYIYADSTGKIANLVARSQPNLTDSEVSIWATQAVSKALSFDYVQYRSEMQDSQKYFTSNGWEGFQTMLQSVHLLDQVTDQHLIMRTTPTKAPTVVSSGNEGGTYVWHIAVPMQIEFFTNGNDKNSTGNTKTSVMVNITVSRVSEFIQSSGVGISRIFMENM